MYTMEEQHCIKADPLQTSLAMNVVNDPVQQQCALQKVNQYSTTGNGSPRCASALM